MEEPLGPEAPLIDSHCHLDFENLEADRAGVLARARAAGVVHMVTVGCAKHPDDVRASIAIAELHPGLISATIGVHPHDAEHYGDALEAALAEAAAEPVVVAIGEMGLDFHYDNSPRDRQRDAFRRQIAIARQLAKPIVVHTRSAPDETLAILKEEQARDVGGIIHCFSEDSAFARRALDLGFVASFSGLVTFRRGVDAIREAARTQPHDALLVETDAPFLAPIPYRGKRNEPAYVAHTARALAELRGDDEGELRRVSTENARRVLKLG